MIIQIFIIVCILVMLYSGYNIVMWYIGKNKNDNIKKEVDKLVSETIDNDIIEYNIDFTTVKNKNKEVVAYLKVNGTNIDYFVTKGNNNSYYLKHNLYKEYSIFGWVFMDYRNKLDGNDKNIIIYGHNTKDGSMFGSLKNIITKEWYENEDNRIINLVFEDEVLTYQVFSTYSVDVEDYYITTNFKDDEFGKFANTIKNRSVYDYGISVNNDDKILTLSTCTGNGKRRMVLHAKLVK